ncbi:MAG: NAD(P)-dependent oxidoreductase, partial [Clostridia bacterium]
MKTVFITGASGSMGSQVLKCIMGTEKGKFKSIILLRDKPSNQDLAKKLAKEYGSNLEIVFG